MGDLSYLFGLWRFEDEEAMRSIFRRRLPSTLDDILAGEVWDSVDKLNDKHKRILLRRLAASVGHKCEYCYGKGYKKEDDKWVRCLMCETIGFRGFKYDKPE